MELYNWAAEASQISISDLFVLSVPGVEVDENPLLWNDYDWNVYMPQAFRGRQDSTTHRDHRIATILCLFRPWMIPLIIHNLLGAIVMHHPVSALA